MPKSRRARARPQTSDKRRSATPSKGAAGQDIAERPPSEQSLAEYRSMRDFERTSEPAASDEAAGGPLTFVVQKHRASRLHYDFRLELDGVLKSWPLPRGPSLDPAEKRLAVMVEDHPLDYASFEGVITKGQYGAGEVIVWDHGTYAPDEGAPPSFADRAEAMERMRSGIAAGKLSVTLRGEKLRGSWALVKTRQSADSWLFFKHTDEAADSERDILDEDGSVISGLTIEDLQAGRLPDRSIEQPVVRLADLPGVRRGSWRRSLKPMHATLADGPFSGEDWLFEPKLDGIRALALIRDGKVDLRSRNDRSMADQYPALIAALARQPANELVLDGEIVALDEHGVPSFEVLQQRMNLTQSVDVQQADAAVPVIFFAFDLLFLDGYDLRRVPLEQRKPQLARVVQPSPRVQRVEHVDAEGEAAFDAVARLGFEGLVAKRRDSVYEAGKRSRAWLKIKARTSDGLRRRRLQRRQRCPRQHFRRAADRHTRR